MRVESIKTLGVTINRRISVTQHVDNLLMACARTLFALRTLRNYGLSTSVIHAVFQATVIAKLSYMRLRPGEDSPVQLIGVDWWHSSGTQPCLATVMTRPRLYPAYVMRQTAASSSRTLSPTPGT